MGFLIYTLSSCFGQEEVVSQLHFCEVVGALGALHPGGSFVLKMFTLFEVRECNLALLWVANVCAIHFGWIAILADPTLAALIDEHRFPAVLPVSERLGLQTHHEHSGK
jgi:hypothetical protein